MIHSFSRYYFHMTEIIQWIIHAAFSFDCYCSKQPNSNKSLLMKIAICHEHFWMQGSSLLHIHAFLSKEVNLQPAVVVYAVPETEWAESLNRAFIQQPQTQQVFLISSAAGHGSTRRAEHFHKQNQPEPKQKEVV